MSINPYVSAINIDSIANSFGPGLQSTESNMDAMVKQIEASGNPSQQDLFLLQSMTVKWQTLVQTESTIVKSMGESMKSIVNNFT